MERIVPFVIDLESQGCPHPFRAPAVLQHCECYLALGGAADVVMEGSEIYSVESGDSSFGPYPHEPFPVLAD